MVEFCSVDPRLLPTLLRAAGRPRSRRRPGDEAIEMGAAALLIASAARRRTRRATSALDAVWAAASEAGVPIVFHVGGTGRPDRPELLRQRPADPARLPRRRGELPVRRLHGHPRAARADAGHDDLRRCVRTLPRRCGSASSSRARSGCRRGCARWKSAFDAFARHEERLQALSMRPSEYVRRQMRVHAVPHRGRRLDHRAGRARRSVCSPPTTRTSRAGAVRSNDSRQPRPTRRCARARRSTTTTSST